jgi:hypothetical protein
LPIIATVPNHRPDKFHAEKGLQNRDEGRKYPWAFIHQKSEAARDFAHKAEAARDFVNKAEAARDFANKAEAGREFANKAEANRDYLNKTEAAREFLHKAEANRDFLQKSETSRDFLQKTEATRDFYDSVNKMRSNAASALAASVEKHQAGGINGELQGRHPISDENLHEKDDVSFRSASINVHVSEKSVLSWEHIIFNLDKKKTEVKYCLQVSRVNFCFLYSYETL